MGLAGRRRAGRAARSDPDRPLRRGRGYLRPLAIVGAGVLATLGAVAVVPFAFLVPLPRQPGRPAADVAADLGLPGGLVGAGGTRTWVVESGPRDGIPVVLVHGFGGSSWSWRATMPALAAAGYRAIALDLPSFGLADKSWDRDTSHAAQAEVVAAVMDAGGIARATLVGHSMGANVVAWFAARHPDRIQRAVLVDASTGPAAPRGGPALLGSLVRLPNLRRIGRLVLRSQLGAARMASVLRTAYADPARVGDRDVAGYVAPLQTVDWDLGLLAIVRDGRANALRAPIGEVLRVPAAIIWGRHDRWIRLASGRALRAALPDAEWHIIDAAGHLPMEEQPDAFNDVLLAWLESTR